MGRQVLVTGLAGLGEIRPGDDLAAAVLTAAGAAGGLRDGDIVAVSSKVISKAEGRVVRAGTREQAVAGQTVRVVAERLTPRGPARIVRSRSGPVLAAAGVDSSNVPPGTVLLLPADPDASARRLRAALRAGSGRTVAVIITDTLGRPWRDGQIDAAIGAAGIDVVDDLRGGTDDYGNPLEATVRAVADELAAAADLVKRKLTGVPVAVVRGLADTVTETDGPGAATLIRPEADDWFRYGHVEAVWAALGVPPGAGHSPGADPGPVEVPPGDVPTRLRRALAVALAWPGWQGLPASPATAVAVRVRPAPDGTTVADLGPRTGPSPDGTAPDGTAPDGRTTDGTAPNRTAPDGTADPGPEPGAGWPVLLGALGQRLQAACWAEDLHCECRLHPGTGQLPARLQCRVGPRTGDTP